MKWTAIVPIKQGGEQKTRLSSMLSPPERQNLAARTSAHVLGRLRAAPEIARLVVLTPSPLPSQMQPVDWWPDLGRGLNVEIASLYRALGGGPVVIVHADIPLLEISDLSALLNGAEKMGVAIAPDRHKTGTNALALMPRRDFQFSFGENSCAKHVAAAPGAAIIERIGLSHDIDTPDDLRAASAQGFSF